MFRSMAQLQQKQDNTEQGRPAHQNEHILASTKPRSMVKKGREASEKERYRRR
jgi:hypothetical protein